MAAPSGMLPTRRTANGWIALRAAERKRAEVSRRIHALYMERIVKPKRAQEARQRARMEEKACRDRESDEWYASL